MPPLGVFLIFATSERRGLERELGCGRFGAWGAGRKEEGIEEGSARSIENVTGELMLS